MIYIYNLSGICLSKFANAKLSTRMRLWQSGQLQSRAKIMRLFTFWWPFSRVCPPPPINNVENILFDKPWPQNRFNNIAQGGGGQEPLLQEGEGQ
jgi:hypothetical protein